MNQLKNIANLKFKILLLFLLCAILFGFSKQERHFIKKVYDGDTILSKNGLKIRFLGINCPEIPHKEEKGEEFGFEAKELTYNLTYKQTVLLRFQDEKTYDHYGRSLAYVFLPNGIFVNAELVKQGLAYCYFDKFETRYDKTLLIFQRQAMTKKLGIWSNDLNLKKRQKVIGNINSKVFHLENCKYTQNKNNKNLKIFKNQWLAYWEGYAPHKECVYDISIK